MKEKERKERKEKDQIVRERENRLSLGSRSLRISTQLCYQSYDGTSW